MPTKNKGKVSKAVKAYVSKKIDASLEDKFFYTTANWQTANVDLNTSGICSPLSLIGQSDDEGGRIGDRIRMKSYSWNAEMFPATAQASQTLLRMIMYIDKTGTSTAAGRVPTDILQLNSPIDVYSPLCLLNGKGVTTNKLVHILEDHLFKIDPIQVVSNFNPEGDDFPYEFLTNQSIQTKRGNKGFRKHNQFINYIGDDASINSAGTGQLCMLLVTNVDNNDNTPAFHLQIRVTYEDA